MSTSLREQLLKAGLVSEKQVKEADKQTRKPPRKAAKPGTQKPSAAQREQASKAARDRELNRRNAEKAAAKAREAQVRQLVEQHRLPSSENGEPFHFQDGSRIKRIYVDAEHRRRLTSGELAIARYGKGFALVPLSAAARIRERDPKAIVDLDAGGSGSTSDDYAYKGFEVPDDLMW